MSLLNLVQGQRVYTQQIQHDLSTSNIMVNCDPRLKGPKGSALDVKSKAGKIGVEDEICDLNVANLTVNGKLTANIGAEVCDIVCPEDFSVRAARNSLVNSGNGQIVYSNLSGQTDLSNNIIQNVTGLLPNEPAILVASVANPATLYGAIQWRLSTDGTGAVDGIFVNELVNLSAGTVITITQATLTTAAGNPAASGDLIFSITAADVTLSPPEGCIAMLASNLGSIMTIEAPPPLQNNSCIHVYADSYVDIETREHVNMSMGNYFIVNAGNTQPSTITGVTEGIGQRLVVDEQLFRIEAQEINIGKPTITGNLTVMNGSCNSVGRLKGASLPQTFFIQGIGTEKGGANTIQFTTGMGGSFTPIVVLSYQGGILTGTAKPQITLVKTTNTNFEIDVTTSPVPAGVFLIPGVSLGNFAPNPLPGPAAPGVYNCTTTSVGGGTGAILKVTISAGGNVDSVEVLSSGGGYAQGDIVTVPVGQITGATADLDVTVNSNELGIGLLEDMYINYQIIGLSEL